MQPDLAPGATLRFAVSRNAVAGLPAFRLPPHTGGSNLYAYMVVSPGGLVWCRRSGCSLQQLLNVFI